MSTETTTETAATAGYKEDLDMSTETEICAGDYVVSDCGRLGGRLQCFEHEGHSVKGFRFECISWDTMYQAVADHMDQEQFWPGAWYIDDHGGIEDIAPRVALHCLLRIGG